MNLNDLNSRVHLPSVVSYYGMGSRFTYHKIPGFGWYGKSMDSDLVFNFIDLFRLNHGGALKRQNPEVIQLAYHFFVEEHPELLEIPTSYSEATENKLVSDYLLVQHQSQVYRACRDEALNGNIRYHDRMYKVTKLLEDLNMSEFIKSGVGVLTHRVIAEIKALKIPISDDASNKLLIPTFYSPDGRLATLETCPIKDISQRKRVYINKEIGWYGRIGSTLVGNVKDLLTQEGCTWDRKLAYWGIDKPLTLHHSLQASQCIDIWINSNGIATDKNPLDLLKETNQFHAVKDHLRDLTLTKVRELEKASGQQLYSCWLTQRYAELTISGTKFSCRDGKYYYQRGNQWLEFTNFSVHLTKIKKEADEWYQYGQILMNELETDFKVKRKEFCGQHALIQTLTTVLLEAGVGIPMIAPNLKHYIINVIDAFNSANHIERPEMKEEETAENTARNIQPTL